jgi:hypothetical protein
MNDVAVPLPHMMMTKAALSDAEFAGLSLLSYTKDPWVSLSTVATNGMHHSLSPWRDGRLIASLPHMIVTKVALSDAEFAGLSLISYTKGPWVSLSTVATNGLVHHSLSPWRDHCLSCRLSQ